jgi:UrcA family protein
MTTIRNALVSFAATAALGVATFTFVMPAHAQDAASRAVSYADLDLGTAQGRAVLETRVNKAASNVPFDAEHRRPAEAEVNFQHCRQAVLDQANTRLAAVLGRASWRCADRHDLQPLCIAPVRYARRGASMGGMDRTRTWMALAGRLWRAAQDHPC